MVSKFVADIIDRVEHLLKDMCPFGVWEDLKKKAKSFCLYITFLNIFEYDYA